MASPVFHPFTQLPLELRLQIWEEACFISPTSHYHRLHYIDIRNGEVVPVICDWPKSSGQISTTKSNRSAYLIDGGLWRACKESREVIARCSHFNDWVRIQKQAIVDYKYFYTCNADWAGGSDFLYPHPAIIDTRKGEEECRMLVYPAVDLFCIQPDNWINVQLPEPYPDIEMSFIRYNKEHDQSLFEGLFIQNLAIEFDSSWFVDLPNCLYRLTGESSARGHLASLLTAKAVQELDANMWIVDKEAKWFKNASEHNDTVYRDCDAEYIEVKCDDIAHSNSDDGAVINAVLFLKELTRLGFDDMFETYESFYGWQRAIRPNPQEIARLLVRRDNEVKVPTYRCKSKCDGHGWCICSNDEQE